MQHPIICRPEYPRPAVPSAFHLSFRAQPRNLRRPASHQPHTLAPTSHTLSKRFANRPFPPPAHNDTPLPTKPPSPVIPSTYPLSFRAQPRNLRRPARDRPNTLAATLHSPGAVHEPPSPPPAGSSTPLPTKPPSPVIPSTYLLSFRAQPRNLRRPARDRPHTLAPPHAPCRAVQRTVLSFARQRSTPLLTKPPSPNLPRTQLTWKTSPNRRETQEPP